jgi:acyl-[acyl-carrier-protein] desaturase
MPSAIRPDDPEVRARFYCLYRDFFRRAEKKRRWSLDEDIPWGQVNRNLHPIVADVVESFCAVELFLPDYLAKALPMLRGNRAWTWFHANWGYEESKHSLALGDWLLRSGMRTEEQMADLESQAVQHEWNVPHDSPHAMYIYAMVQELATFLHYRNLRQRLDDCGSDPALAKLLTLIAVDERAHHTFYRRGVQVFLELDRPGTLELLRRVLHTFSMPAVFLLADSRQRLNAIKDLKIFDDEMYMQEVYEPILNVLGVQRRELRLHGSPRKAALSPSAP